MIPQDTVMNAIQRDGLNFFKTKLLGISDKM